jgi:hypothetical protein
MTVFVFWNLHNQQLGHMIANLAVTYDVDVFMLAECDIGPSRLLSDLNRSGSSPYHYVRNIGQEKIQIYTKFSAEFVTSVLDGPRFTIRHVTLPATAGLLLVVSHFPSKVNWDEHSQAAESTILAQEIAQAEVSVGHQRTVLVGDLNMNPFESGVVNAAGLHAVMSKSIALNRSRTVQGRSYRYFYNPMWSLLGDASDGPPGTHYYNRSSHREIFWNMFDQVLIRPDLLDRFNNRDLMVLDTDGTTTLLTANGLPDTTVASDHLPILFTLNL